MKTFNDETRAAIARAWAESQLTQEEYAARFGISSRTLRLWVDRYASRQPPLAQARAVIADAIEHLRDLLAAVDAQSACQAERGVVSPAAGPACRPAVVLEPVEAKDVTANAAVSSPVLPTPPGNAQHADLHALVAGVRAELMTLPETISSPTALRSKRSQAPGGARPRLRAGGVFANWTDDDEADASSRLPPARPPG